MFQTQITTSKRKYYISILITFVVVVLGLPWLENKSQQRIEAKQLAEGFTSYIQNKFIIGSPTITIIGIDPETKAKKTTIFLTTASPELYKKIQIGDTLVKLPNQNYCIISRKNYTEKVVYMKEIN